MNAMTSIRQPEGFATELNIELLSDEELHTIGGGGAWGVGAMLLAGGAAAAGAGVAAGVIIFMVARAYRAG